MALFYFEDDDDIDDGQEQKADVQGQQTLALQQIKIPLAEQMTSQYSWGDYFSAANKRSNIADRLTQPYRRLPTNMENISDESLNRDFDVQSLSNTVYEQYSSAFLHATTEYEAEQVKQSIDEELHAKEVLASMPWYKNLVVQALVSFMDPIQLTTYAATGAASSLAVDVGFKAAGMLPVVGPYVRLTERILKPTAKLLLSGAAGQVAYEHELDLALQATSPIDEEKMNFSSTMHAAVMGAAMTGVSHVTFNGISKAWKKASDTLYDYLTPDPTNFQGVSAQALSGQFINNSQILMDPIGKNKYADIINRFVLNTIGRWSPANRIHVKGKAASQQVLQDLIVTNLQQEQNWYGVATPTSVEAVIARTTKHYRDKKNRIHAEGWKSSGIIDRDDFDVELYQAYLQGGVHTDANIARAAGQMLSEVGDPLQKALEDSGVLERNLQLVNAQKYIPVIYDKMKIKARRPEFVKKIENWFFDRRDTALKELPLLDDQIIDIDRQILKLTGNKPHLQKLRADKQIALEAWTKNKDPNLAGLLKARVDVINHEIANATGVHEKNIRALKSREMKLFESTIGALNRKQLPSDYKQKLPFQAQATLSKIEADRLTLVGDKEKRKIIRKELAYQRMLLKQKPLKPAGNIYKPKPDPLIQDKITNLENQLAAVLGAHGTELKALRVKKRSLRKERRETAETAAAIENIPHYANQLASKLATGGESVSQLQIALRIPGRKPGTYKKDRVIDIPQTEMTDFLDTNILNVFDDYIKKSVADSTLSFKFGRHDTLEGTAAHQNILKEMDDQIRANPEQIDTIKKHYAENISDLEALFQRMRYQPAPSIWNWNIDWRFRQGLRAARAYAALCSIGKSSFSLIPDLASAISVRGFSGLLKSAPITAWRTSLGKLAKHELATMNVGCKNTLNQAMSRDFADLVGGVNKTYGKLAKLNGYLSVANHYQQLANASILLDNFRASLIENIIQKDALWMFGEASKGTLKIKDRSRLASIGITEAEAAQMHELVKKHGGGDAGYAGVDNWDNRDLANKYADALQTYITKHDLTTSHLDQPLAYDNPFVACIMQFSGWSFTLANKIIVQGTQNNWSTLTQTMIGYMALGLLAYEVRYQYGVAAGTIKAKERTVNDMALGAFNQSGLGGIISMMGGKIINAEQNPNRAINEFMGPVSGLFESGFNVAHGLHKKVMEGESLTNQEIRSFNNLLPFAKYFIVDGALAAIEGIRYDNEENNSFT